MSSRGWRALSIPDGSRQEVGRAWGGQVAAAIAGPLSLDLIYSCHPKMVEVVCSECSE